MADEVKFWHEAFEAAAGKTTYITVRTLSELLEDLGMLPKREVEFQQLIMKTCTDFCGGDVLSCPLDKIQVTFAEFLMLVDCLRKKERQRAITVRMKKAFSENTEIGPLLDKNKDNAIDRSELKYALGLFGEDFTNDELDDLVESIDKNEDGNIDMKEFKRAMGREYNEC